MLDQQQDIPGPAEPINPAYRDARVVVVTDTYTHNPRVDTEDCVDTPLASLGNFIMRSIHDATVDVKFFAALATGAERDDDLFVRISRYNNLIRARAQEAGREVHAYTDVTPLSAAIKEARIAYSSVADRAVDAAIADIVQNTEPLASTEALMHRWDKAVQEHAAQLTNEVRNFEEVCERALSALDAAHAANEEDVTRARALYYQVLGDRQADWADAVHDTRRATSQLQYYKQRLVGLRNEIADKAAPDTYIQGGDPTAAVEDALVGVDLQPFVRDVPFDVFKLRPLPPYRYTVDEGTLPLLSLSMDSAALVHVRIHCSASVLGISTRLTMSMADGTVVCRGTPLMHTSTESMYHVAIDNVCGPGTLTVALVVKGGALVVIEVHPGSAVMLLPLLT